MWNIWLKITSKRTKLKKYNKFLIPLIIFHLILFILVPIITANIFKLPAVKKLFNRNANKYEVMAEEPVGETKEATLTIKEDGYVFEIQEVSLKDEGMIITGNISGPELKYNNGVFPADVEVVPKDFKEDSTTEGGGNIFNGNGESYTFKIEEKYKTGAVKEFISTGKKYITLDVMIYRRRDIEGKTIISRRIEEGYEQERDYRVYWKENDEPIKEFKSIKVPFKYLDKLEQYGTKAM